MAPQKDIPVVRAVYSIPKIPPNPILVASSRPPGLPPPDTTDEMDPTLPPRPLANSYWATPQLLASEYPGGPTTEIAIPRLQALLDVGVVDFIDLTEARELVPYDTLLEDMAMKSNRPFARLSSSSDSDISTSSENILTSAPQWHVLPPQNSIRYGRFSIRDRSIPTQETLRSTLSALVASGSQDRKAVIHCWGGIGRTGTLVGCWYVFSGIVKDIHDPSDAGTIAKMAGDCALDLIRIKWRGVDKSWRARRSPETTTQEAVVRTFRTHSI